MILKVAWEKVQNKRVKKLRNVSFAITSPYRSLKTKNQLSVLTVDSRERHLRATPESYTRHVRMHPRPLNMLILLLLVTFLLSYFVTSSFKNIFASYDVSPHGQREIFVTLLLCDI